MWQAEKMQFHLSFWIQHLLGKDAQLTKFQYWLFGDYDY
jgi:hypothetical protein